jgi:hypothetical protein
LPLTVSFSVSQSLADPSTITIADTSTGSNPAIVSRRVYIRLSNGTYLVQDGTTEDYEVWAIADTTITLDLLPRSEAPQIIVEWMDVDGNAINTATEYAVFTWADYVFLYQLTQTQAGRPKLRDNRNYYYSKIRMFVNVEDAENAVDYASDIWNSQESLDDNYYLMNNQQLFF